MKIYLVNLDKNADRLAFMKTQLERLGLEFERIPAVYGAALSAEERRRSFSSFRSLMCEGFRMQPGEIGCSLSHDLIYRKMLHEGVDVACVLEDDAILAPALPSVLNRIAAFVQSNRPQVVMLSALSVKEKKDDGIDRIGGAMCTDGYVITRKGAETILRANFPVISTADKWGRWVKRCGLELYRAWPTTVTQDNAQFGTDVNVAKRQTRMGLARLIHKGVRMVQKFADWVMFRVTGR